MDAKEYRTVDKSGWDKGPWQHEPDKIQFADEATGLPCLIVRNPHGGHLCGYVGVAAGHPAFGVDFEDVRRAVPDEDGDERIDVHGGLTFSDRCQPTDDESHGICHVPGDGEPDHVWWLGFDCAHSGDKSPGYDARRPPLSLGGQTYKTVAYVKNQCARLAHQLAERAP